MDANDNNKHCSGDWSDDEKPTNKRIKQEFDSYNDYMVGPNRNSQFHSNHHNHHHHHHPTPMNQLTPPHPSSSYAGPRGMPAGMTTPGMTSTTGNTPRTQEENAYEGIDSARQWNKQSDVKPTGLSKFFFFGGGSGLGMAMA